MRQDDLVALNAEVLPKLLAKIRPEARRLLDLHRHAGRNTYIVSAAPVEIVEPLARSLGMTAGIGTRGEVVDGVYTGELDGPFCYGAGKVEAMQEIARWDGLDLGQCYAYCDSASDLPMLEAVGHPVAVNPDGSSTATPAPTAGRSCSSASARSRSSAAPSPRPAPRRSPAPASPPARCTPAAPPDARHRAASVLGGSARSGTIAAQNVASARRGIRRAA